MAGKTSGATAKTAAPTAREQATESPVEPAYCQQKDQVADFEAPEGGVELGRFYRIGSVLAFAASAAPEGRKFQAVTAGLFMSAPKSGGAWRQGEALSFDAASGTFSADGGSPVAYAANAADADAASGRIRLTGQIG